MTDHAPEDQSETLSVAGYSYTLSESVVTRLCGAAEIVGSVGVGFTAGILVYWHFWLGSLAALSGFMLFGFSWSINAEDAHTVIAYFALPVFAGLALAVVSWRIAIIVLLTDYAMYFREPPKPEFDDVEVS